jgi:hypothetical protein
MAVCQWLASLRTRSPPAPVTRQLRDFKLRRPSPPWTRVGDGRVAASRGLDWASAGPALGPGLAGLVTVTESVLHSG